MWMFVENSAGQRGGVVGFDDTGDFVEAHWSTGQVTVESLDNLNEIED